MFMNMQSLALFLSHLSISRRSSVNKFYSDKVKSIREIISFEIRFVRYWLLCSAIVRKSFSLTHLTLNILLLIRIHVIGMKIPSTHLIQSENYIDDSVGGERGTKRNAQISKSLIARTFEDFRHIPYDQLSLSLIELDTSEF